MHKAENLCADIRRNGLANGSYAHCHKSERCVSATFISFYILHCSGWIFFAQLSMMRCSRSRIYSVSITSMHSRTWMACSCFPICCGDSEVHNEHRSKLVAKTNPNGKERCVKAFSVELDDRLQVIICMCALRRRVCMYHISHDNTNEIYNCSAP